MTETEISSLISLPPAKVLNHLWIENRTGTLYYCSSDTTEGFEMLEFRADHAPVGRRIIPKLFLTAFMSRCQVVVLSEPGRYTEDRTILGLISSYEEFSQLLSRSHLLPGQTSLLIHEQTPMLIAKLHEQWGDRYLISRYGSDS